MGSLTDCLGMIPGALMPTRCLALAPRGPAPSMGFPRASTTRPNSSEPTGTSTMAPVLLTTSPSLMSLSLPKTTTPTLSGSKFRAIPFKPELNSTISSAWMFFRPYTRAIPSPMLRTRPVSSRFDFGAAPRMRSSKMDEISAEAGAAGVVDSFLAITPMAAAFLLTCGAVFDTCLATEAIILAEIWDILDETENKIADDKMDLFASTDLAQL